MLTEAIALKEMESKEKFELRVIINNVKFGEAVVKSNESTSKKALILVKIVLKFNFFFAYKIKKR